LGLSKAVCHAIGIGYAAKGTMRGRVVFPFRLSDSTLAGYIGLATAADQAPLLLFPKNFDDRFAAPVSPKEEPRPKAEDLRKLFRAVSTAVLAFHRHILREEWRSGRFSPGQSFFRVSPQTF
jgi:hypothetical protein